MIIAVAGGGSGGHIYPIRSLIQYMRETGTAHTVYRFGSAGSMEEKTCMSMIDEGDNANISLVFIAISSGKRRRQGWKTLGKNITDLFRCGRGCLQSVYFLKKYSIESIFCKGGFVALPVVCAAALTKTRLIIHESDLSAGLVNRFAHRFATKTFVGFHDVLLPSTYVGQIISPDIFFGYTMMKDFTQQIEKWIAGRICIFVFGGSLGSQSIYDSVYTYCVEHPEDNRAWIIVGGSLTENHTRWTGMMSVFYFSSLSQQQMSSVLYLADRAVMRAGTTSLAEAQLFGIRKIIVPLIVTHDQAKNAQRYADTYHDIIIDQNSDNRQVMLFSLLDTQTRTKKIVVKPTNVDDPRARILEAIVS